MLPNDIWYLFSKISKTIFRKHIVQKVKKDLFIRYYKFNKYNYILCYLASSPSNIRTNSFRKIYN